MPASYTANLSLALPQVDFDAGWGTTLNSDFVLIDDIFTAEGTGTSVGVNIGSGKKLVIGGSLILGSGDATNSVTAPTIRGAAETGSNAVGANLTIKASNGTGSGGSGDIIFQTAAPQTSSSTANSFQNTLVLKASGNVGLNTNSPSGILDVYGSNSQSTDNWAYVRGGNTETKEPVFTSPLTNGNGFAFGTNYEGDKEANIVWDQTLASTQYMSISKLSGTTVTEQLRLNASGSIGLAGANYGTAGQVLTSNGNAAAASWENSKAFTEFTSESFSNTASVAFTGILSTVESLQIVFHKVKPSVNDENILIQLGTGTTTYATTGYTSYTAAYITSTPTPVSSTSGFVIRNSSTTAEVTGILTISRIYGDTWDCSYSLYDVQSSQPRLIAGGGYKALSGNLTAVKVLLSNGGNITSGNVRLMYQS